MHRPHTSRMRRQTRRCVAALGLALAAASLTVTPEAQAWSTPQPLYNGAAREVFGIAGDPFGNAFAVIAGESLDRPLLLIERYAETKNALDAFIWRGAEPLPGGERFFTNALSELDSFKTLAAGDGVGLIVWREVSADGRSIVRALLREPPLHFTGPFLLANADVSPRADESASLNASGDALVALRIGRGVNAGRTAFVRRQAPGKFGRVRTLSASATGKPSAALGGDGSSTVAWIRGTRVEVRRIDSTGRALKTQRLGTGKGTPGITTAVNQNGAAMVAWQDNKGAVRASRLPAPGRFQASRRVRAIAKGATVDGLASGIDSRGRTFVAWRERTSKTRRVRVASATPGGAFKVTQMSSGKTLGVPSITMRPGGGAVVAWRTTSGWKARTALRNGVFAVSMTVSRGLVGSDLAVAKAAPLAGPGTRVDLVWLQASNPPEPGGALIYSSFQDEDTAPGA